MECQIQSRVKKVGIEEAKMKKLVFFLLRQARASRGSVGIRLIGDSAMRGLNRAHRGLDKTTDVLSFRTADGKQISRSDELGDVCVSIPQIRRQAKRFNVPFEEEFYRSLAHGALHIIGHDHVKADEAKRMWSLQEKAVAYAKKL